MKKIASMIILVAIATSASATENAAALFKKYNGCFILYNLNKQKIVSEYNPNNRCNERIAPDSTFKVPLSLMAFDKGIINQKTVFKWDGKQRDIASWNQDQTPYSWIQDSALWVSQVISPKLGYKNIKHYLANFAYGNQNFSGDRGKHNGITHAWLSSSLKISAFEQLHFLNEMLTRQLIVSNDAVQKTEKNMYLGKLQNGADYFGKTGSGYHNTKVSSHLRDGWFIGFIMKDSQQYIFISNLTDKVAPTTHDKAYGSEILKPITLQLLNQYFS